MYNFDFLKNEELVQIFEDVWIAQGENGKNTTIALTNQRLLFLDYDNNDPRENLRISGKLNYIRYKEVYYMINLESVKSITNNDTYIINLIDGRNIEFDNEELYHLIKMQKKKS